MYADRHSRRQFKPASMAAAVGINAALIAALLLSSPELIPQIETTMRGYNVPIAPPPPPEPVPPPKDSIVPPRDTTVITPKPDVLLPPTDTGLVTTFTDPPIDTGGMPGGTGTGTIAVDPPVVPAPILVDATPDPRAMRDFQPPYPPSERREGTEGRVTVRVLVGADGRVKAVEAVGSGNEAFLAATKRQALSRWRFRPATRDGVPYETWRTMTVRFVLEG